LGNIVETASDAGQFQTLLAAAKAAGLVPALTGDGPLTVFAPTDEAFGALPAGTIDSLLKEENRDTLKRILTYHVVSGQIGSDALADKVSIKTLAGPRVVFTQSEEGFTVEGARIVATDIDASNGVVHVIDRVIMPPQQMSRSDAERMIMTAISRGVPMFNHGNPQATAKIYQMTAEALMDNAILRSAERKRLEQALAENSNSDSAEETAWKLRYALDDVVASMRTDITL
jgi:transforming growth factor-beta-induced protein